MIKTSLRTDNKKVKRLRIGKRETRAFVLEVTCPRTIQVLGKQKREQKEGSCAKIRYCASYCPRPEGPVSTLKVHHLEPSTELGA